ncbi:prepilin-type N-terminal cleavage/methylation domain-containing protein [Demequina sp. SYSU T00192]|uniref:Prepilin-type N-terminal cleavage/methylation domain-containing protein n=1 Tax=Demequina litoralis TaxID=3051660 RepID=A0ABT8G5S9_9MICO|nr:prepilin-type N-terminal cleavage/methylation domain-containing protein [Demequina sp. SYSU T00192]MDN4474495.1 prepilin-type N-terminal cleavage/methylation domain-containing protein [Demequina sp. SYSU T00192]
MESTRWSRPARSEGFTLVEVVVAMFVLAVVMLAILFLQARAMTINADSQGRQSATAAANEAMEQLRAMPWNYLRKGLSSQWNAGGTDPFVSGADAITVNGKTYALRVGTTGSDQDLSNPWPPLFDSTGSNEQMLTSGSGNGDVFELRAYTFEDDVASSSTVGLLVVATWGKRTDGSLENTVITSTAYAPSAGCGDLNNAPFLASCQAQFDATAASANLDISVTASTLNGANPKPLLNTDVGLDYYSFQVNSSTASVQVTSQQVSNASAFASLGGTAWDDDLVTTAPSALGWTRGYTSQSVRASDDTTAGAEPPNPPFVTGSGANSYYDFTLGDYMLSGRSDDGRSATVTTKTGVACATGLGSSVPGNAPCASSLIGGTSDATPYMSFEIDGKVLDLAKVNSSMSTVYDEAWAGRFAAVAGNSDVGCASVSGTGSGCTSAGAQQGFGRVTVGDVKQTNTWDDDAPSGLVVISGYEDSVRVQRGESDEATAADFYRSATIEYWNGTDYSTEYINDLTADTYLIPDTVWTTGDAVVTASGNILVTGSATSTESTTNCVGGDGCIVDATNGTITVTITYDIEPTDASLDSWSLTVKTTLNGSRAGARFEESPNA